MLPSRVRLCVVVVGLASLVPGCALLEPATNLPRQAWQIFRPKPSDYRDTTEEDGDQWSFVGVEGRGDRPLDKENDPFKPYLMSEKARNIERNLGIE